MKPWAIHSDMSFRLRAGAFSSKLAEMVDDYADEYTAEFFLSDDSEIQVRISKYATDEGLIHFTVENDLDSQLFECQLSRLNEQELRDLFTQVTHIAE